MSLNSELSGRGEQWLVLLHGLFGSIDNLGAIARPLGEHFKILSIDLPNHGRSPWVGPEAMSLAAMAAAVAETAVAQGIERAHWLGHSLGGKVAMELALSRPELVDKLIVADIAPVSYPRRHDAIFAGLGSLDLDSIKSRKQAGQQLQASIQIPAVRQFLLKNLYRGDDGRYHWRPNLKVLEQSYPEFIAAPRAGAQFDGPVLFLKGDESDYILAEYRPQVVSRFPNAALKVIQGTGHWLHAEKPAVFTRLCEKFLI
ncbi:MAG: alpha/beta fold hydrolase [Cellvibrionaceae bacterium]|nr:alpha/beta fold hydrolase [Cellvibrionaceae bacterium]MCV6625846.1 alpha/beta fold hydrolase [Cellvibrionaceae bacterium]